MAAVRRLPCSVTIEPPDPARITRCAGDVEADHMGARGVGQKAPDRTCAPMCSAHHRQARLRHWRDRAIWRAQLAVGARKPSLGDFIDGTGAAARRMRRMVAS